MQPLDFPPELARIAPLCREFVLPCVAFSLTQVTSPLCGAVSKLGGSPDLPDRFDWPHNHNRPLDFLLQINLSEAAANDTARLLPPGGLLTFFYDLEKQPWGYDPDNLQGFYVAYTPPDEPVRRSHPIGSSAGLSECSMRFTSRQTLPVRRSQDYQKLDFLLEFTYQERDAYSSFAARISQPADRQLGRHRLLGHADNIQGDMQWEAQLVMNGLYCGDDSGYNDPRREALEDGLEDWILLLQLDSDDVVGLEWGDAGMLYYWIRKQDLAAREFDRVWMTLQCF